MDCEEGGCQSGDTHDHEPDPDALRAVRQSFADASVENPDGTTGITLHTMQDEALREVTPLRFHGARTQVSPAGTFDELKHGDPDTRCDGHFGTPANRSGSNCANALQARQLVFHYAIYGHNHAHNPGSSGFAEVHGNDFIVTLRLPEYRTHAGMLATEWGTSRDREWQTLEAGTFMHELGHNLALEHGGDQSRPNYKPNYLSVMNYNYQWNSSGNAVHIPGASRGTEVRTNRPLDFSRDDHVTLQESNLPEQDALGDLPADWRIRYGPNVDTSSNGGGRVAPALGDDGDVDWNGDRSLTNGVSVNLNGNGSARDDLGSYDDWDNITYNFRTSPDFSFGSHQTAYDHGPEQNATDYINGGLGSTDEDGDGIPNAEDDAPLEPGSNSSTPSSPATSSPGWVGIGAILGVVVIMLVLYVVRRRHQS